MSHTFDAGDDLFAPRMKRLSLRAIAVNRRRQTLAASTLQQYGSRFRGSLWEILNLKPRFPEGQQFFRHYLTIEKHLLLFLDNETVPPTNYSSEQALRWSVVFCKVTHGFCSDWGAELFAQVRSFLSGVNLTNSGAIFPTARSSMLCKSWCSNSWVNPMNRWKYGDRVYSRLWEATDKLS